MAHDYTLEDLARLLRQKKRHGCVVLLSDTYGLIAEDPQATIVRLERIIEAISPDEQKNPDLIGPSERDRIASVCGLKREDIEHFLQQFGRMRARMRWMAGLSFLQRLSLVLGWRKVPETGEE